MAVPRVSPALRKALAGMTLTPADAATVALARRYAADIDDEGDLAKLGPALLACLTALGMSPAARAAATKGVPGASATPTSRIDELRERRARKGRTTGLDPTAP